MHIQPEVNRLCYGKELFEQISETEATRQYQALLRELSQTPDKIVLSQVRFSINLSASNLLYAFLCRNSVILATARATLLQGGYKTEVRIDDVVVKEGCQRQGLGATTLNFLEELIYAKWGLFEPVTLVLSNRPSRGNGQFYENQGWEKVETQVWSKPLLP